MDERLRRVRHVEERVARRRDLAQPVADHEQHVGVAHALSEPRIGSQREMADVGVGAVVDVVLAAPARRHRQRTRGAPASEVVVGLDAPRCAPDDDERPLGAREHCPRALDVLGIRVDADDSPGLCVGGVGLLDEHVLGEREHNRSGASGGRDVERAGDELGDPVGIVDLLHPLRHRAEHVPVVDLLERLAAHHVAADLPDQEDQRRRVLERGVDAAGGVRGAGAAGDHADPRPAGELAVGVGHVRGANLVAARDEADRRVVERVEHCQVALAGDAERDVHPVDDELVDEEPASGPHFRVSRCSRKTVGFWSFGRSSSAGST